MSTEVFFTMVNRKLKSPQEVEVHYILPALRRDLSIELKALGLEQKEIARLLGVSAPAVSQYITEKRGADVRFSTEICEKIKASAGRIAKNASSLAETQALMRDIRLEKITCQVCQGTVVGVPVGCMACFKWENGHLS